jgi:hypothetical protein
MTDAEIEDDLKRLGRATEPQNLMVSSVMRRIAEIPSPAMRPVSRRNSRVAATIVLAAAACIAVLIFVLRSSPEPKPRRQLVVVPQTHPSAFSEAEAFPRLADYRRAYERSPDAFEALLQQPASKTSHRADPVLRASDASDVDSKFYQ